MMVADVQSSPALNLFYINKAGHISSLGFAVVYNRLQYFARRLSKACSGETKKGTLEQYREYEHLLGEFLARFSSETFYEPGTPDEVRAVLERYRGSNDKLRVFYGDRATGRDWLEESDVVGRVRRSLGPMRVPLLIRAGANGGPALLTHCIVRIIGPGCTELYRHPTYHQPPIRLGPADIPGYTTNAWVNEEVFARFKTEAAANRWLDFIQGRRLAP